MTFADLHNHALWGVDDGAKSQEMTLRMLDAAYADGTRVLCLTPHYHPGYFGDNRSRTEEAFGQLRALAAERYPELELYLGNELRYSPDSPAWLCDGHCRTLNGTDYVLVDFSAVEPQRNILRGINRLLGAGYTPVLAHVERYRELTMGAIRELASGGVWLQLDVQSLFGGYGFLAKQRAKVLLKERLVDLVSSDAHDLNARAPVLSAGYGWVEKKYTAAYADAIFRDNAIALLREGSQEGREYHE